MNKSPKVSFIIPTLNAAKILPRCLSAIRRQNFPLDKVEIIVADGGSKDKTIAIAKKFNAKVIKNPEILHEPGKHLASRIATGKILFFTDSDNVLVGTSWIQSMLKPYFEYPKPVGYLPQTIPAYDTNPLDRYLGYLSCDPFTWFVYQYAATPRTYNNHYKPVKKTKDYIIYKFSAYNHPLFGLSQGVGTLATFKREAFGHADDILSGIKLITEGGTVAYVPEAAIYHYHVGGFSDFIKKYSWRIRNNLTQKIKGMGLINRQKYMNNIRKVREVLFVPYSLSLFFPCLDAVRLLIRYRDIVVILHPIACLILSALIIKETIFYILGINKSLRVYGK